MYRAVTLAALRAGIDLSDGRALAELADGLNVSLQSGRVFLGDEDVTTAIRTIEVTKASRFVADSAGVRRRLVEWQRSISAQANTVTEGRDQGTVVFPDAHCKFFLTAADEERARRRVAEHEARGEVVNFEAVLEDQRLRDARDRARAIAPMKPAEDAAVIDTTGLTIDQVVDELVERIEKTR
jgi:cytidylate kinase